MRAANTLQNITIKVTTKKLSVGSCAAKTIAIDGNSATKKDGMTPTYSENIDEKKQEKKEGHVPEQKRKDCATD